MRRTVGVTFLIIVCLLAAAGADERQERLRLSKEEAKQLHALLLAGELQDFGDRANSPSAYLMAAELLLDYPTRERPRTRVLDLCGQALELGARDDFLMMWAQRLKTRLAKTPRAPLPNFIERSGTLQAQGSTVFEGSFSAGWVKKSNLTLELLDDQGRVLDSGSQVWSDRLVSRRWRLKNTGDEPSAFQVVFKVR